MESDPTFEYLSSESVSTLNYQQKILYANLRSEFLAWLRDQGKYPERNIGYEESNIRPIARRVHQVFEYVWESDNLVLELTPAIADQFIEDLNENEFVKQNGDAYSQTSKRKFSNDLETYFEFTGVDWTPDIEFVDEEPSLDSDPFTRDERGQLLNTAFEYRSPPSYSNLTPEERDRWKATIAEYLGKPKSAVTRSDWDALRRSWKVPSMISVSLDCGPRAKLVHRLNVDHVDLDNGRIVLPPEIAVKNDQRWVIELSNRSMKILEHWFEERTNNSKYDERNALWLNREGNRYNSDNLNDLLSNLIEESEIAPNGRKLTWHSIRHSTGMYVYDRERDLALVAEILRHKSLEAARRYAHPTPETKKDVIESIQGGVAL